MTQPQSRSLHIRPIARDDADAVWAIFHAVVAAGDTYVFAPDAPREAALDYFFGDGVRACVAVEGDAVLGMYRLVPNQRDLGAHVANASFMVAPGAHGRGIGEALARHCLREARRLGYRAMQFNFVVASNRRAVALWQRLGFDIVGTLPQAFRHATLGFVDAHVMFRRLDDIDADAPD